MVETATQNEAFTRATTMFTLRPLTAADADDIARVHAESWRSAYRGILPARYLDDEVADERRTFWQDRLRNPMTGDCGFLAYTRGAIAGFAFGCANHSPEWGHLLDNLHVLPALQGRGAGRILLQTFAEALTHEPEDRRLHLWVYEENRDARHFYERLGAKLQHSEIADTNGGGRASCSLYAWASTALLHRRLSGVMESHR
jgi:ribosomal protein S18 acetylase RimI-like enzyme